MLTEIAERFASQRLRSPLARAVVPVLGGAAVLALIMLATWGVAAWISGSGPEVSERLAPSTFPVGRVEPLAEEIAEDGPLLFPGLNTTTGARTVVLHHEGDDPTRGWTTFWAYPADMDPSCTIEQIEGTRRFTDCRGREIDVTELARPETVRPVVENQERLSIDLRVATTPTTSG